MELKIGLKLVVNMKTLLIIPASIAFIGVVLFLYAASIIVFPVLGAMLFLCPHAPFVMGYKVFNNILDGDFKKAFE